MNCKRNSEWNILIFYHAFTIVSGNVRLLTFWRAFIRRFSISEEVMGGRCAATVPRYPLQEKVAFFPVILVSFSASRQRWTNSRCSGKCKIKSSSASFKGACVRGKNTYMWSDKDNQIILGVIQRSLCERKINMWSDKDNQIILPQDHQPYLLLRPICKGTPESFCSEWRSDQSDAGLFLSSLHWGS